MYITAVCTGKVGVALAFGTVVTEFEMPCSFLQEGFVDKASGNKTFKGAIDCNLVWSRAGELCGNLFLGYGAVGVEQDG